MSNHLGAQGTFNPCLCVTVTVCSLTPGTRREAPRDARPHVFYVSRVYICVFQCWCRSYTVYVHVYPPPACIKRSHDRRSVYEPHTQTHIDRQTRVTVVLVWLCVCVFVCVRDRSAFEHQEHDEKRLEEALGHAHSFFGLFLVNHS